MAKPKIYNRYENMDFPKYEFREYPKIIDVNGDRVHVASREEDDALRSKMKMPPLRSTRPIEKSAEN